MQPEEAGASTTAGGSTPTNAMSPQELALQTRAERKVVSTDDGSVTVFSEVGGGPLLSLCSDSGDGYTPVEVHVPAPRWKAKRPTGAFDSIAASFRYTPRPYSWYEVLSTVGLLYGVFIGLPVAGAFWSVHRIGTIVGWW